MSDVAQGPGWWQASDGKWYPPEQAAPQGPPAGFPPPAGPPAGYGQPAGYGAPAMGAPGAGAGQLAEWPERALAGLIDLFAIGIFANIVSFAISSTLGSLLSLIGLAFAIYNAFLNGSTGRSVGKRIVGLKVVSEQTGQPIGGGLGVVRWIAHFVDSIICLVGWLFPLWDSKKQTIADKIMKTVVLTGQPKDSFGDAIKPS